MGDLAISDEWSSPGLSHMIFVPVFETLAGWSVA